MKTMMIEAAARAALAASAEALGGFGAVARVRAQGKWLPADKARLRLRASLIRERERVARRDSGDLPPVELERLRLAKMKQARRADRRRRDAANGGWTQAPRTV